MRHSSRAQPLGIRDRGTDRDSKTATAQASALPKQRGRSVAKRCEEREPHSSSSSSALQPRDPTVHTPGLPCGTNTAADACSCCGAGCSASHPPPVPAPTSQVTCGRRLPTSPRRAKGSFSHHGCGKACSSHQVTQQSLEDDNTYLHRQSAEGSRFSGVPVSTCDSLSPEAHVLTRTQHSHVRSTLATQHLQRIF